MRIYLMLLALWIMLTVSAMSVALAVDAAIRGETVALVAYSAGVGLSLVVAYLLTHSPLRTI